MKPLALYIARGKVFFVSLATYSLHLMARRRLYGIGFGASKDHRCQVVRVSAIIANPEAPKCRPIGLLNMTILRA